MTERRLAVVGNPIRHSLSPRLHTAGFSARGWADCRYEALRVDEEHLPTVLEAFPREGGIGLNVTRPLKTLAAQLATQLDFWAETTAAVNTLVWGPDGWRGANTDAPAFRESLVAHRVTPHTALIWGAGGAARATWAALTADGVQTWLAARRPGTFAALWLDWDEGIEAAAVVDLLVNATPLGQEGEVGWERLPRVSRRQVLVDWVYAPETTPLVGVAREAGAVVISGLELLVRQASLSWVHWFSEPGPLAAMGAAVGWAP